MRRIRDLKLALSINYVVDIRERERKRAPFICVHKDKRTSQIMTEI